jgi:hypothetical protein
LKLHEGESATEIVVRVFAPRPDGAHWSCDYEIDWPEGTRKGAAHGFDSVQALLVALNFIGSELYTSDYHKAGSLAFAGSWKGYGFPVPQNLRDLLIGDDAKYF